MAQAHGLKVVVGNVVHLKTAAWFRSREVASIHDIGLENDIAINPTYPRAAELLQDLGIRVFGASPEGPVEPVHS